MPIGQTPVIDILLSISDAAARAVNSEQAVNAILQALVMHRLVVGAAVEMPGEYVGRIVVGDGTPFEEPNCDNLRVEEIPTASSLIACLLVPASPPPDPNIIRFTVDQLALALDRVHLHRQTLELHAQAERRIREVSTVYDIGRAMDMVEIDKLLEIITEKAANVMDAQACSLMRLNPDTNSLTIAASHGLSEDVVFVTERAIGEGIAGRVAQTGEALLITDNEFDPRLRGVALRPDIGSSMVVPMKDEKSGVIGVLSIRRRRPMPDFTQDDLRLFSVIASQAALAISNKQLYDAIRRRLKELATISDITQAVISHLDLNSLLDHVADNIVDVVKLDRCCVYLLDKHTRRFVPRIIRGYKPDVVGRNPIRLGEGVVGIVARKQIPIVEADARNAMQPMRGFARALGTNSFLAIPILSRGHAIGVVVADNKLSGRKIHADCEELLTTFVNQAGIAIENAQLYEDRELRYQEMNRLATQTDNILRSIAGAVIVVDTQGKITRWSKAAEELWGVSEEQAYGLSYSAVVDRLKIPAREADRLLGMIRRVHETGMPTQGYKVGLHPKSGAETFVNLLVSPLIDRQGVRQGVVIILEDVTREVKMEAEIERYRRLADIGQLAAKMAHEVRNPLSSIKGAAQLMRNEYEDLAPFREFLDIIIDEVNGLSKITTDLLDFARPMQPDFRVTNLNMLVDRTLTFLRSDLESGGNRIVFHPDPEIPDIVGDPKQIEQVLRNIVINAGQAMPDGGTLRVTTGYGAEGFVTAHFHDTGVGIPPDKIEEMFQPFITTKTKGTGLGLPIVRRIIENHGGAIHVDSKPGKGTSFSVSFPIHQEKMLLADQIDKAPSLPDL